MCVHSCGTENILNFARKWALRNCLVPTVAERQTDEIFEVVMKKYPSIGACGKT